MLGVCSPQSYILDLNPLRYTYGLVNRLVTPRPDPRNDTAVKSIGCFGIDYNDIFGCAVWQDRKLDSDYSPFTREMGRQ